MKGFTIALCIIILPISILIAAQLTLSLANKGKLDIDFTPNGHLATASEQEQWQAIAPKFSNNGLWKLVTVSGCKNAKTAAWKARQLHTALHRRAERMERFHLYFGVAEDESNQTIWKDVEQRPIQSCPSLNSSTNQDIDSSSYVGSSAEYWLLDSDSRLILTFDDQTDFKAMLQDVKKLIRVPSRKD